MRKFRFNLLYILVATLFAGALQSCDDNYFRGEDGSKVTITATTAFSNTTSRAVYEDDTYFENEDIEITNYCFLLFDSDKKLIDAFDVTPSDMPYSVELDRPLEGEKSYYAFLLGNVDEATLGAISEIDDLKSCTFAITRTYNNPKEDEKDKFTWSGYLPFTQSTQSLDFVLNPNVAKITANITNKSSESVIKSVRVKNVLSKVGYAQNALNEYDDTSITNVSTVEEDFIKYDIETLETPIEAGQTKTISWYVPQNIQGEGERKPTDDALANESGLDGGDGKDGYLPANATYVEIDGVRTSDNVTASYRVYPGIKKGSESYAEMTNFDIKADVIYNLDVTINNDGIDTNIDNGYKPNDGSTATAKIKLPENSNCYMIHPIGDRIADVTVYELPISRINQYWTTVAGEDGTADSHHALTADSKWQVEVIWQDINKRAIRFCDEYGNTLNDVAPGEGLNPFCFKLENISAAPGSQTYGNVLVGIKKLKSDGTPLDGYCWSWHLWITDYNPDAAPAHATSGNKLFANNKTSGKNIDLQGVKYGTSVSFTSTSLINAASYSENVSYDGNVQHYNSEFAPYWTNSGRTASSSLWDGTGIYADKWIMDRNIGALSPNSADIENPLDGWGMYYQYGRKDPFSYKKTFDIEGNVRPEGYTNYGEQWKVQSGQGSLSSGVMNPNVYYAYSGHWASDPKPNDWSSPDTPKKKGAKTLFDPCPPGWCVPLVNTFKFAEYTYPGAVFNEYSRTFAENIASTSNWNHSAVCVYINVCGEYRNPDSGTYAGGQYPYQVDYPIKSIVGSRPKNSNTYNDVLASYGNRWRNQAVVYSTDYEYNGLEPLKSIFPLQGHINGNDGLLVKVFDTDRITPIQQPYSGGEVWRNYTCSTYDTAGLQARMWGVDWGSETQGYLVNILPSTLENNVNGRHERRCGLLYMRFHGALNAYYYWNASNGFNVRCIQEPD